MRGPPSAVPMAYLHGLWKPKMTLRTRSLLLPLRTTCRMLFNRLTLHTQLGVSLLLGELVVILMTRRGLLSASLIDGLRVLKIGDFLPLFLVSQNWYFSNFR